MRDTAPPESHPTIRLVIVDDHTLLREGTRQLLEDYPDMEVVGEAERGDDAMPLIQELQPHVVILDVQLPGISGIEVTRQVAETCRRSRVLILTAHDDEDYLYAALSAGASGYLLKTIPAAKLADAIRAVHAGGSTVIDSSLTSRLMDFSRLQAGRKMENLTPREREVVRMVGSGLSNKGIAARLGISRRTVEGHLHRIFEKEDVSSRVELLRHAWEHHLLST